MYDSVASRQQSPDNNLSLPGFSPDDSDPRGATKTDWPEQETNGALRIRLDPLVRRNEPMDTTNHRLGDIRGLGTKMWLVAIRPDDEAMARDYLFLLTGFWMGRGGEYSLSGLVY